MRRFTRRQLILTPATILIVAGFLWLVGSIFLVGFLNSANDYVWIRLPFHAHGCRIRLLSNEHGLQVRTYFGVWHDFIVPNVVNPFTLMLGGYTLLLGLLPIDSAQHARLSATQSGIAENAITTSPATPTASAPNAARPRNLGWCHMNKSRRETVRHTLLVLAACLILCGFTLQMLSNSRADWWPWWPDLQWVQIPYHDWRIRLRTDETGAICIRGYIGFWFDLSFHPMNLPLAAVLLGNLLLLPYLPGMLRAWAARHRWRAGFCQQCNYNLTGNVTGICPECGAAIKSSAAQPAYSGPSSKSARQLKRRRSDKQKADPV